MGEISIPEISDQFNLIKILLLHSTEQYRLLEMSEKETFFHCKVHIKIDTLVHAVTKKRIQQFGSNSQKKLPFLANTDELVNCCLQK